MVKNSKKSDVIIDEFEPEDDLEFSPDEELDFAEEEVEGLLDEEEEEDLIPSLLYKGGTRPKTEDDWRQLLLQTSREGVPAYQISDAYKDGALVLHPVFGLGVVIKVVSPRKMEVIFETSKKLMAMNVAPPQ